MSGIRELSSPDWQPIETAPKDGTAILVHEPGRYGPWIDVARWHEYWDTSKGASVEGWFDNGLEQRTCDRPTHWMPLPLPPEEPRHDA